MVVGIVAVLKAGGTFVPLDPTYPAERLRFILRDTQAPLVLTQEWLASDLRSEGIHVIDLDADTSGQGPGVDSNPDSPATFDSAAYIMYTSGSTGTPKGVVVPHRGIIRLVFGVDYVPLDSSLTILHLASPSFDASTFELWGALLNGGRAVLYPGRVPALDVLERVLREHGVNTLFLTTALFHAIVDESAAILSVIHWLIVGGEVLSVDHVRRAYACLPDTVIVNAYGPTEATTFATAYRVPRRIAENLSQLPIGMPISNTTISSARHFWSIGTARRAGRNIHRWPGVARGYWNQPKLSVERFVPDPFASRPSANLYRTGDLGRRLPDGNIEFLGRLDGQVKVRGFRIELGEVEAALRRHGGVRDTVVMPVDEPGELGGDWSPTSSPIDHSPPAVDDLRDFLKTIIPEYMVPSAFVLLDHLPRSLTGKVDRRRLPAASGHPVEHDRAITARTQVEIRASRNLCRIAGSRSRRHPRRFFRAWRPFFVGNASRFRGRRRAFQRRPAADKFVRGTDDCQTCRIGRVSHREHIVASRPADASRPTIGVYPLLTSQLSIWNRLPAISRHDHAQPESGLPARGAFIN